MKIYFIIYTCSMIVPPETIVEGRKLTSAHGVGAPRPALMCARRQCRGNVKRTVAVHMYDIGPPLLSPFQSDLSLFQSDESCPPEEASAAGVLLTIPAASGFPWCL